MELCPVCGDSLDDGTGHPLCDDTPAAHQGPPGTPLVISSLAGEPTYREPIIGPFIAPGDMCYFVGQDGTGKTRLVADILIHANDPSQDEPLPLYGAFTINRSHYDPLHGDRTLIVDGENSADEWRRHLGHVMDGYDIPADRRELIKGSIFYVDAESLKLGTPYTDPRTPQVQSRKRQCLALARLAASRQFKLVVMDPVWNCFAPESPKDDSWVTHGLSVYHREAQLLGITTLIVAHPPMVDPRGGVRMRSKPFGSTQQNNCIDARILIEHNKDRTGINLTLAKDRTAYWIRRESRITLYFNPKKGGGYERASGLAQWPHTPAATLTTEAQAIFRRMPDGRGVTSEELTLLCEGHIGRKRVDIILSTQLVPSRLVHRTGTGRKGNPFIWWKSSPDKDGDSA